MKENYIDIRSTYFLTDAFDLAAASRILLYFYVVIEDWCDLETLSGGRMFNDSDFSSKTFFKTVVITV